MSKSLSGSWESSVSVVDGDWESVSTKICGGSGPGVVSWSWVGCGHGGPCAWRHGDGVWWLEEVAGGVVVGLGGRGTEGVGFFGVGARSGWLSA